MTKKALIIFTRNPELGKCKTRLAKTLGDVSALNIYKFLLEHTADITKKINVDRFVFYSDVINFNDGWHAKYFNKKLQKGDDLGERMQHAFEQLFNEGYEQIIIIGSDLLDLNASIIEEAYDKLKTSDVVIGPAKDGGYYLLGLKTMYPNLFKNKQWGTETVKDDTLNDLKYCNITTLETLNDIDTFEDMKHYEELKQFYSNT